MYFGLSFTSKAGSAKKSTMTFSFFVAFSVAVSVIIIIVFVKMHKSEQELEIALIGNCREFFNLKEEF